MGISIHAPHEGVRRAWGAQTAWTKLFQSTHPTRGCDVMFSPCSQRHIISIHAPHEGVRLIAETLYQKKGGISIHAPHEGVRHSGRKVCCIRGYFNPRTPRGGATLIYEDVLGDYIISIHAPHEGVRRVQIRPRVQQNYFNPRTPRGGATATAKQKAEEAKFQSTHPTRGCDVFSSSMRLHRIISIHSPHEGVRQNPPQARRGERNFNPRTPRGGAT